MIKVFVLSAVIRHVPPSFYEFPFSTFLLSLESFKMTFFDTEVKGKKTVNTHAVLAGMVHFCNYAILLINV